MNNVLINATCVGNTVRPAVKVPPEDIKRRNLENIPPSTSNSVKAVQPFSTTTLGNEEDHLEQRQRLVLHPIIVSKPVHSVNVEQSAMQMASNKVLGAQDKRSGCKSRLSVIF